MFFFVYSLMILGLITGKQLEKKNETARKS